MKFTGAIVALSALAVGVSALDKPLDIKTTHSVEPRCTVKTKVGDKVEMHYRGTLEKDGSEFDASYNRGTPLSFTLGKGQVIKGWDEGLQEMCVGDKRTLTIQPEYGYGDRGVGPIPGGATLIFETELIKINGKGAEVVNDEL
ncbi:Putative FKBP-type peptidyl-prolyl cis-trans isomerase domain-containing protein [Septoria linicola]|uniref:peptidylprolyl isomerase n=1 Tax=Septoria linicola TaxID=215465 RepID=A0A9Q9ADB4_9PEZI|nr:putative FKBP-type peptidyl-prolyl cis-trans isomerase domain-containing protein [Septoria linicola]USW47449.1 Putative FKBP-type peptidyl-prolyl cis-trans isomerase domain-containing protein [Septoria linicola]